MDGCNVCSEAFVHWPCTQSVFKVQLCSKLSWNGKRDWVQCEEAASMASSIDESSCEEFVAEKLVEV